MIRTLIPALAVLVPVAAAAQSLPARVGRCAETTITEIGSRLEGVPDSGSAVSFANRGYQVSYNTVRAVRDSRVGDRVRMCLDSVPRGCPSGDRRGRTYTVTNLRTQASWTLPDSQHMCGGA